MKFHGKAKEKRKRNLYDSGHAQMFGIKKDKQRLHANFRIGRIIGDGNFAIVRECIHRKTHKRFALKIINKAKVKGKEHMIENEIHILRKIVHPNIVKLHEEFETAKEIYLVMELVAGGDLFDSIVTNTRFSEPCSAFMIRDLASAVKYLHDLNIVHRDIKPENLLVVNRKDGRRSIKLADFGLSMEVEIPLYLVCGTPTYVAPEILDESGYGLKVDIWAIGVICYILLCGFPPFRSANHDQEELFDRILRGDYEYLSPFWDDVGDGPKDLIDSLLVVDASERYDAEQVLHHDWIKKWVEPMDSVQVVDKVEKNRKSLRGMAIAIQSILSLLKLVRSRRQGDGLLSIDTAPGTHLMSEGAPHASPNRSRIPRPKPSAGFHIAEIRKSISTPTRLRKNEDYKPAPSPDCSLKTGFLKQREEAIKRVSRSDSAKVHPSKANIPISSVSKFAKIRPTSAIIKRTNTNESEIKRPCNPRRYKHANDENTYASNYTSNSASNYEDANSKASTSASNYGDKNPKASNYTSSYGDISSKLLRKPSIDKSREIPVRKGSTRLRPRSMIETTQLKASSELNILNVNTRSQERQLQSRKKSHESPMYAVNSRPSGINTPSRSGGHVLSDEDLLQDSLEYQHAKCECPPTSHITRPTYSQSNLESQKIFTSGQYSHLDHGNGIRKSRSSCRKVPRKPVCRHASSIQTLSTEKYAPKKGLYRVKSLESNHILNPNKLYKSFHEVALPPWNPSTNLHSRISLLNAPMSPRERSDKKTYAKGEKPRSATLKSNDPDKGIRITTEVNKRKNIKFPDGKTVDEEVKTTTTVSVSMESPEEECKETSLLAKVKNLAIEIGSLAKETYKLSESSSDSLINLYSENKRDDSDSTDNLSKEETDRFSETEYLSAFRKN